MPRVRRCATLMALSVLGKRGANGALRTERVGLKRDLGFFLVVFAFAGGALFLPADARLFRLGTAILLVGSYFLYVLLTERASAQLVEDGHGTVAHTPLFLTRIGLPESPWTTGVQVIGGRALLVAGAKGFVNAAEHASSLIAISPLMLSLLMVPSGDRAARAGQQPVLDPPWQGHSGLWQHHPRNGVPGQPAARARHRDHALDPPTRRSWAACWQPRWPRCGCTCSRGAAPSVCGRWP